MSTKILSLFTLLALSQAFSQTTAGLNGTIKDATGAVVAAARGSILNADTGVRREAVTNDSGGYEFLLLQPGSYGLTALKEGFKQITQAGIRLEVNQIARVDLTLQLGAISESVEVKAAAPLLE